MKELFESPIQQVVRMHEEQLAAIDDWIEALSLKISRVQKKGLTVVMSTVRPEGCQRVRSPAR